MKRQCVLVARVLVGLGVLTLTARSWAAGPEAGYRVLAADKGKVAIVDAAGKVEWEYANNAEAHDLWQLKNGNILLPLNRTTIAEVKIGRAHV